MKKYRVVARMANGAVYIFRSTNLASARAMFNQWRNHWASEYVSIR